MARRIHIKPSSDCASVFFWAADALVHYLEFQALMEFLKIIR